ncbi:hypothetical protein LOC54_06570 [Acetobacter sp. AN02]|uniref:hypothetical protein n=1 Tax=Acetobacter sp. AN02 TaxID=2894186 RepID=UPI0024342163|nr:hypothetical protein [Acetobacter sp. AN02]MDG6094774.1 hypothetical protein [Acetobacter sp. AN02]
MSQIIYQNSDIFVSSDIARIGRTTWNVESITSVSVDRSRDLAPFLMLGVAAAAFVASIMAIVAFALSTASFILMEIDLGATSFSDIAADLATSALMILAVAAIAVFFCRVAMRIWKKCDRNSCFFILKTQSGERCIQGPWSATRAMRLKQAIETARSAARKRRGSSGTEASAASVG